MNQEKIFPSFFTRLQQRSWWSTRADPSSSRGLPPARPSSPSASPRQLEERLLAEHLRGDEEVGQLLGVQLQRVHVGTYQAHYCPSIPGLLFVFPETGLECRGYWIWLVFSAKDMVWCLLFPSLKSPPNQLWQLTFGNIAFKNNQIVIQGTQCLPHFLPFAVSYLVCF